MKKTTIVIIDDHTLIREMWIKMFEDHSGIEVMGDSGTLDGGLDLIKTHKPDIVILDINLGLESGFDAVPLIRRSSPGTRIIIVSMHTRPAYAKKMMQLGAKAYITKNSSTAEMIKAVDEVMNGKIYMCTEVKDILVDQVMNNDDTAPDINDLSLREIEIIKLIKEGLSSKEISSQLHIGIRTIEVHRHNILKKLKLKNTASLINFINNTDLNFI